VRRFLVVISLILLPGVAAAPVLAHSSAHTANASHFAKKKCPKGKKYNTKKKKCVRVKVAKPTPTSTATPTETSTPTPTPTQTSTPTVTPTVTLTPTPLPSTASLPITAYLSSNYKIGLYVCGLPNGSTAAFSPNPGVSKDDQTSPAGGSVTMQLTVTTPYGTISNIYPLAVHAFYQDPSGNNILLPPSGISLSTRTVLLAVQPSGSTSLTPSSATVALGNLGCSLPPTSFGPPPPPTPTATAIPLGIYPTASVAKDHPSQGDIETVYGKLYVNGSPQIYLPMHTTWSFPVFLSDERELPRVRGADQG
jgi:hypothetical protein